MDNTILRKVKLQITNMMTRNEFSTSFEDLYLLPISFADINTIYKSSMVHVLQLSQTLTECLVAAMDVGCQRIP